MAAADEIENEFRPPPSHVWIAAGSLFGFAAVGGLWAWAATADPRDTATPTTVAAFGVVVAYIVYRIRLAAVSRLHFYPDRLRIVGAFRVRDVAFADIDTATWRNADSRLVLRAGRRRIGLSVFACGAAAGRDVRESLRAAIPAAVQRDWLGEPSQRLLAANQHLVREAVRWYAPAAALVLLSQLLPDHLLLHEVAFTLGGVLALFPTVWGPSFGPPVPVASQEPA